MGAKSVERGFWRSRMGRDSDFERNGKSVGDMRPVLAATDHSRESPLEVLKMACRDCVACL
jgi:hypothetical protein